MLRGRLVLFGREVIDLAVGRIPEARPEEGPLPQPCTDPACKVCPGLTEPEPEPAKVPLGFTRATAEIFHLPQDHR